MIELGHITVSDLILVVAVLAGGLTAWRSKRGDFYKAVAEEKTAETERLRADNKTLRQTRDLTPIIETLHGVTAALERHTEMTEKVFDKVADMNGALRAHGEAMKALADHLILDEAARGLLETATKARDRAPRRRTP